MAPSSPCGSDRPDTSLTSSGYAPARGAMQYRSQCGAKDRRKHRQTSMQNWHVACCGSCTEAWTMSRSGQPVGRSGVEEKPYGKSDTDHQQQELFILVAARLAAD